MASIALKNKDLQRSLRCSAKEIDETGDERRRNTPSKPTPQLCGRSFNMGTRDVQETNFLESKPPQRFIAFV
jgi:hypothetical protein